MTDCPNGDLRDLLPDLLHDRLDAVSRRAVESHLVGCSECRAELALLAGLRGALRGAPVDVDAIVAALPAYRAPSRRAWGGWRAAAAIAAIAVGGGAVVVARQGGTPAAPAAAVATVAMPNGITTPAAVRPVVVADAGPARAARVSVHAPRELPVRDGFADLTEGELSALLAELESLDAMPSVDVDTTALVHESALPMFRGTS